VKPFDLISFASADELACAVATAFLNEVEAANREKRRYTVAVSGGRITQKFFASVVEQAKARATSFGPIHFFWADERCVPPDDPESNFRMARELLFEPLDISENRIHRVRGEDPPEAAAKAAEAEMLSTVGKVVINLPPSVTTRLVVSPSTADSPSAGPKPTLPAPGGQPVLDLVMLGLGEDGHVASLFPGEPEELISSPAIYRAVTNSPKPPPNRVTLGYAPIVRARLVWVLVSGSGKTAAFRESLSPAGSTPLACVLRRREGTKIFTDVDLGQ
jgi:6-phosphogluconolactonase